MSSSTTRSAARQARRAVVVRLGAEDPHRAAHFLIRLLFCLFAEDVGLLPENLFTRMVQETLYEPAELVLSAHAEPSYAMELFRDGTAAVIISAQSPIGNDEVKQLVVSRANDPLPAGAHDFAALAPDGAPRLSTTVEGPTTRASEQLLVACCRLPVVPRGHDRRQPATRNE